MIFAHFSKYGEIEHIKLKINSKTRLNRGYAFIKFKIPETCRQVILERQVIDGRQIDCKISYDASYNEIDRLNCSMCKIYVHNLGDNVNKNELKQYFQRYGRIKITYILINSNLNGENSDGFVYFDKPASAQHALDQEKVKRHKGWICENFFSKRGFKDSEHKDEVLGKKNGALSGTLTNDESPNNSLSQIDDTFNDEKFVSDEMTPKCLLDDLGNINYINQQKTKKLKKPKTKFYPDPNFVNQQEAFIGEDNLVLQQHNDQYYQKIDDCQYYYDEYYYQTELEDYNNLQVENSSQQLNYDYKTNYDNHNKDSYVVYCPNDDVYYKYENQLEYGQTESYLKNNTKHQNYNKFLFEESEINYTNQKNFTSFNQQPLLKYTSNKQTIDSLNEFSAQQSYDSHNNNYYNSKPHSLQYLNDLSHTYGSETNQSINEKYNNNQNYVQNKNWNHKYDNYTNEELTNQFSNLNINGQNYY